jgi:uroporphyrinogen decarboxylase
MRRRAFLAASATAALAQPAGRSRERMLAWLAGKPTPGYTPAAFFLHFDPRYKAGLAAAQKHVEFHRATGMDFVKIQFEQTYERQPFLQTPADWAKLTLRKLDFYEPLLVATREIVKQAKRDSLVLMTLYSPYMCAGHCATSPVLKRHLEENPEAVKKGLDVLTESQMLFVRACIDAGVDGFYMSTQGSEKSTFSSPSIFAKYIKPYDLVAMKEAAAKCAFNILHVCDYVSPYMDYNRVLDYPGQVVNCNFHLTGQKLTPKEAAQLFRRPIMGGLDRHGALVKGTPEEVEVEIRQVIRTAPKQFVLGADCTVASTTDWARLRHAIEVAHRTGAA